MTRTTSYLPSFLLAGLSLLLFSCNDEPSTLFKLLSSKETGIHFANTIEETDTFNILTYEYIYNGGGVGVGDFNNDGLSDVFFAGNVVPNKLYINQGNLSFKDVTDEANVNVKGRWNSGVSVVDINNDGLLDIYISTTMMKDSVSRKNILLINKGLKNGIPSFVDEAEKYGLDDDGFCQMSAFFDYDHDGDLDVYLLINQRLTNIPTNYRPKFTDGSAPNTDRLYRNNGDGTFTNVSKEAGILIEGFGLGLSISDFNNDGWPDVYVSNDYLSNDILYINNQDGTFKNRIAEFIGHQSQFSMGNDAADINNDALPDIVTLDMLPETNARKKTTIGNKTYLNYINNEKFNYEYQYVRNMVHLNNGLDQQIKFSEVGQLAGVHQTEWSWSPLFVDFDNDGLKDLIITNGFPKDITDKDFANYRADVGNIASVRNLIDSIPVIKIPNYVYKNNGDLNFQDVTKKWGFDKPSFSNGAVFADLDNDGDLDYVLNNINDEAFVYENTLYRKKKKEQKDSVNHYLRVKLTGSAQNKFGVGTRILLYVNGNKQLNEQSPYRGFLSSVEDIVHFGLGKSTRVDSLIVEWPNGKVQTLTNVNADQVLKISYDENAPTKKINAAKQITAFKNVSSDLKIQYKHQEEDKIDYNLQRTLPHKFTQSGPGVSIGDINNDGLEDFVVGGSVKNNFTVFVQQKDGSFLTKKGDDSGAEKKEEDEGLLLFDADNDGDLDLYVVSGGSESANNTDYQDRLYKNNGTGNFVIDRNALPTITASGSCVRAEDFDEDGDLDLFVSGRVVPGQYPLPAKSYILVNDKGTFKDATETLCNELSALGMITDALWTDFNNDGKKDLVIAGEYLPITFYENTNGKFVKVKDSGVNQYQGWWNSISAGDFDKDGDIDYVVGNLGNNNSYQVSEKYTLKVFAKDFDGNGSVDPVLACYMRKSMDSDEKELFPVHFWDELNTQSPKFRNKYARYKQYSKASIYDLLSPEDLKDVLTLEANFMSTSYVENLGNGKFKLKALPRLVQVAPVNGIVSEDVNHDGNLDVLMVGNDYGNEVFAGRYDAFTGLILVGDGKGNFTVSPSAQSGFYVGGDAKGLAKLSGAKRDLFIATQNRDSLKVFSNSEPRIEKVMKPLGDDSFAELIYENGSKQRVEFYYGTGYLSQSSRRINIPMGVREIVVHNSQGKSRTILYSDL